MQKSKLRFKIQKFKILFLFSILPAIGGCAFGAYFLFSTPTLAAELYFEPENSETAAGQQFKASLMLNTQGEEINALEGTLAFPNEKLTLTQINEGESVINLWVEKPHWQCQSDFCQVTFSGIIPGGFRGILIPYSRYYQPGKIFDLIFQAKNIGQGTVNFEQGKVLLNDGLGSATQLTFKNLNFNISGTTTVPAFLPAADNLPPEPFTPIITKEPSVFEGKYFLVFATSDKGTGIDHYEVKEGNRPFKVAESPYLLEHQKLDKEIIVRAIDKSGNVRTAFLAPTNPRPWYENYWIYIIIIGVLLIYLLRRVLWRKNKKK